jgi:hypothetical protein
VVFFIKGYLVKKICQGTTPISGMRLPYFMTMMVVYHWPLSSKSISACLKNMVQKTEGKLLRFVTNILD